MSEIDLITWLENAQYYVFKIVQLVLFFWTLFKVVTHHCQYNGPSWETLRRKGLAMANSKQIVITTKVIRHQPQFSRLVLIPYEKIAPWKLTKTTTIEGAINNTELGRRSLKHWDERKCWWIDLPEQLCRKAKIETGDTVKLTIRLASEDLPEELQQLLKENQAAKVRWSKLTPAQQRMLREEVFAAKTSATRLRRAAKVLAEGVLS